MTRDRRTRLIDFIEPWITARPELYDIRCGYHGLGCRLAPDDLTDDALEVLADHIRRDFWSKRRSDRESQRRYRERMTSPSDHAPYSLTALGDAGREVPVSQAAE